MTRGGNTVIIIREKFWVLNHKIFSPRYVERHEWSAVNHREQCTGENQHPPSLPPIPTCPLCVERYFLLGVMWLAQTTEFFFISLLQAHLFLYNLLNQSMKYGLVSLFPPDKHTTSAVGNEGSLVILSRDTRGVLESCMAIMFPTTVVPPGLPLAVNLILFWLIPTTGSTIHWSTVSVVLQVYSVICWPKKLSQLYDIICCEDPDRIRERNCNNNESEWITDGYNYNIHNNHMYLIIRRRARKTNKS